MISSCQRSTARAGVRRRRSRAVLLPPTLTDVLNSECVPAAVRGLRITRTTLLLPDDTEREVLAVIGFASAATDTIRAMTDQGTRQFRIEPTGAFVIVATRPATDDLERRPILTPTPEHSGVAIRPPKSYL
jgi:hypothetical protein